VLELYDVTGRHVRTLLSAPLGPGEHRVTWDGTDERGQRVASGAYFARLSAAGQNQTMKLMLVK
jgi:flagellar hook assembly protein FlgD